jgi:hypothetical protein
LDERVSDELGPSHPEALRVREVRARVAALAGDAAGGIRLYRDAAERWHYQGEAERAEAAATHAETLWTQITRPEPALSAGAEVIRMRNQIPGPGGHALAAALEYRAWLAEACRAGGPATGTGTQPVPAADPPAPRRLRAVPAWERPAVRTRTAG